jgi:AGCS family alanine or glycine:cation symporter
MPFGAELVTICVMLFALSTAIGWSYYGDRSVQYLLGNRAIIPYRAVFSEMQFVGAIVSLGAVWAFADIALGLMAIPNLIAILGLSNRVARMTKEYFSKTHVPRARKA